ncbi:MAG TPA: TIGR03118 family protein [Candidatus Acidoferrales bacterium]|nr:TIGR03118 family protein [Candidatus Acidoferrales bacterium]
MQLCRTAVAACLGLVLLMVSAPARAQYRLTNLDSNQLGQAPAQNIDPLLANAWGLARGATSPWWISDNDTGWSTIYDATGKIEPLRVLIPTAGNGPSSPTGTNGPGMPTGIVFNGSKDFQSSPFIFATLDGTISAWLPGVNKNLTTIEVPNPASAALPSPVGPPSFTGLAITSNPSGNFLYAADATNNVIDVFDGNFNFVKSFGDPSIPSTFSVFGIQDINSLVYVTYAVPGVGAGGFVDVFKEDGTFVKTLIQGLPLNQAWGVAAAPGNFGPLSNTLLVSNNSVNGTINAFDPVTGKFVGTIRDENGKKIILNNLWGIAFGGGNATNGATNELFVTVGQGIGPNELAGTFAKIVFKP